MCVCVSLQRTAASRGPETTSLARRLLQRPPGCPQPDFPPSTENGVEPTDCAVCVSSRGARQARGPAPTRGTGGEARRRGGNTVEIPPDASSLGCTDGRPCLSALCRAEPTSIILLAAPQHLGPETPKLEPGLCTCSSKSHPWSGARWWQPASSAAWRVHAQPSLPDPPLPAIHAPRSSGQRLPVPAASAARLLHGWFV